MKTFNKGERNEERTLTVGELKAVLAAYPDTMPVLATWEGIYTCFRDNRDAEYITVKTPSDQWNFEEGAEPCLVFDVDK